MANLSSFKPNGIVVPSLNNVVLSSDKILGRTTAGSGSAEEITLGSGFVLSSGSLTLSLQPSHLPIATQTTLGVVKTGTGLNIDPDGTIDVNSTLFSSAGDISTSGLTATSGILLGRSSTGVGAVEKITLGTGLTLTSGVLSSSSGTSISVADDTTTDFALFPTLSGTTTGTLSAITTSSTNLSYIPLSGQLNAVSFNSTSDLRLKENVKDIKNALHVVEQLDGKTFTFIKSGVSSSGVIAQEIEKVLPDAVNDRGDGYLSVNYNMIVPYLIEAIKELKAEIEILKENK